MLIKLGFILAIIGTPLVLGSAPTATPPPILAYHCNTIDDCTVKTVDDKKQCGVNESIQGKHICYGQSGDIVSDVLKKADPADLGPLYVEMLSQYYTAPGLNRIAVHPENAALTNPSLVNQMVSKINKKHLDLTGDVGSAFRTGLLKVMSFGLYPKEQFTASEELRTALAVAVSGNDWFRMDNRQNLGVLLSSMAKAKGAGSTFIKDNAAIILDRLRILGVNLGTLDPAFTQAIVEDPDNCKHFKDSDLHELLTMPDHAKVLNSEACWENRATEEIDKACGPAIRNLPSNALIKSPPMKPGCYEFLTSEQVKVLDSKKEPEDKCKTYPLMHKVVAANGKEIATDCFENAVANAPGTITINEAWSVLPARVLDFKEYANYEKLADTQLHHIPAGHKAHMLDVPGKCEKIQPGLFTYHSNGVKVSDECFKNLDAEGNQVEALLNADVSDTVLVEVETEQVSKWKADDLSKLQVLDRALHRPNIRAIVENISKGKSTSLCETIENVDELKKARAIQMYGTKECFDSILEREGFKINLGDIKDFDPHVQEVLNMEKMLADMDDSNYRNMDEETFRRVEKQLCKIISATQLAMLPQSVLKSIDGECLATMTMHDQIDKKVIQDLSPEAFAKLEANIVQKVSEHLTPRQFGQASSGVADLSKHFASTWTAAVVSGIKPGDIADVHESAWRAAPREAYAGFTPSNFHALPPASIHVMTLEQLQMVPPEALKTLTLEQAKEVDASALGAFGSVDLGAEVRKAIDARVAEVEAAKKAKETAPEEAKAEEKKPEEAKAEEKKD